MKKIIALIAALILMLAITAVPALAEKASDSPEIGNTDIEIEDGGQKPEGEVTSPDTSDAVTPVIITLAVLDLALIGALIKIRAK